MKWEHPICNNCKSKRFKILWKRVRNWEFSEVFRIVECTSCGLIFVSPRPKKSEISKFYPKKTYWSPNTKNGSWRKRRESLYGRTLYKEIFKKAKKGKILDIGSGTGLFLSGFKEKGWKVSGIDISKVATEISDKKFDIKIKTGDFLTVNFPVNHFDAVSLNGTLEHMYKPKEVLEKIAKILKYNGILEISVPNMQGLGAKIFGKTWYGVDVPRHLYHFTSHTLCDMLLRSGFKIEKMSHSCPDNYKILFESFRYNYSPRFKNVNLKRNGFSSENSIRNIIMQLAKSVSIIIAKILALTEPLIRKGEILTIYATRK
jgi:ubiquinone/menaquinone biosynthesis C-methylase UbiE